MGFEVTKVRRRSSLKSYRDTKECAVCHKDEFIAKLVLRRIELDTHTIISLAHPEGMCESL